MKKTLIVFVALLLIIGLGVGGFLLFRGRSKEEAPAPTPTPEVFVETPLEKRPFVALTPSIDGHWLTLEVSQIQDADSIEYELTYNTGDNLTQGAIGGPTRLQGKTIYEKKILLGTESSGHYRYHEGIEEGNLTVRLNGGPGPRKFTSEFKLYQSESELVSSDGLFSLGAQLPSGQFYLVLQTAGLPAEVEDEEILAGPYGVFTDGSKKARQGKVAIQSSVAQELLIRSWDGRDWAALENGLTSQVGTFILVPKEI
jgi:hypothetical protein